MLLYMAFVVLLYIFKPIKVLISTHNKMQMSGKPPIQTANILLPVCIVTMQGASANSSINTVLIALKIYMLEHFF